MDRLAKLAMPFLLEQIEAVRDLHKPVQGPYDNLICEECSHTEINVDFYTEYPCSTIKALDE
jgi:hypothetical protein